MAGVLGQVLVVALVVVAAVLAHPSGHLAHGERNVLADSKHGLHDLEEAIAGLDPERLFQKGKQATMLTTVAAGASVGSVATASTYGSEGGVRNMIVGAGIGALMGVGAHALSSQINGEIVDPADVKALVDDTTEDEVEWDGTKQRVEFITDVGGNFKYFQTLIKNSKIATIDDALNIRVAPNSVLVIGGDVVDGVGDIRIVYALLALKKRQPNQVHWVLGNRDLNKLRYVSELGEGESGENVDVYWAPVVEHDEPKPWCEKRRLSFPSSVCTARWMQAVTMNSASSFEDRKVELQTIKSLPLIKSVIDFRGGAITDEMVVQSFRNSVDPSWRTPWMLRYLELGNLILRIGDSLFLHGGIQLLQQGFVPNGPVELKVCKWITKLNKWKRMQLQEFKMQPHYLDSIDTLLPVKRVRGGEFLMDYALPGGAFGRSIVTSDFLNAEHNLVGPELSVERWLLANGISRVFTGGSAAGPVPMVLRKDSGFMILNANTRYALNRPEEDTTTAYSIVTITADETNVQGTTPAINTCDGKGCDTSKCSKKHPCLLVPRGTKHGYSIHSSRSADLPQHELVGHVVKPWDQSEFWVTTVLRGESTAVATVLMSRTSADGLWTHRTEKLTRAEFATLVSAEVHN